MKPSTSFVLYLLCLLILVGCKSSNKISSIDFSDGSYTGEVDSEGRKHGKGTYQWLDGSSYEGDFESGVRHGKGHFRWANGEYYKGEYVKDQRTGEGVYAWSDGSVYRGFFLNGKRHGQGIFESANGSIYRGEWFDDLMHGNGVIAKKDGRTIKGKWKHGKLLTEPAPLPQPSEKPQIVIPAHLEKIDEINPENQNAEDPSFSSTNQTVEIDNLNSSSSEGNFTFPSINLTESISDGVQAAIQNKMNNSENEIPLAPQDTKDVENPEIKTVSGLEDENLWTGTPKEAEISFDTKLVNGIDTVFEKGTNQPFSGKMIILNDLGSKNGELELKNGKMHGEELYFENGELTEKNLWENGRFIKNLPVN